jgi:hypothetical protein
MWFRESRAASAAGEMGRWWHLPKWWRTWIVATKEIETDISNLQIEGMGEK